MGVIRIAVSSSEFQGLGLKVYGLRLRVEGFRFGAQGL